MVDGGDAGGDLVADGDFALTLGAGLPRPGPASCRGRGGTAAGAGRRSRSTRNCVLAGIGRRRAPPYHVGHDLRSAIPAIAAGSVIPTVFAIPVISTVPDGSVGLGRIRFRGRRGPPGCRLPHHPGRRTGPHRRRPTRPAPSPGRQSGHLSRPHRLAAHLTRPCRPDRPRPAHDRPTGAPASRWRSRADRASPRFAGHRMPRTSSAAVGARRPRAESCTVVTATTCLPPRHDHRRGARRRPRPGGGHRGGAEAVAAQGLGDRTRDPLQRRLFRGWS